jgi:hypothetical protein
VTNAKMMRKLLGLIEELSPKAGTDATRAKQEIED